MNYKGTPNPAPAIKTTAASRKPTILFADQQKEKTRKYKLVLSWTIVEKYKENSTTKAVLETSLGKVLKYLRETVGGGKVTQPSSHSCPHPKTQGQYYQLKIYQITL